MASFSWYGRKHATVSKYRNNRKKVTTSFNAHETTKTMTVMDFKANEVMERKGLNSHKNYYLDSGAKK